MGNEDGDTPWLPLRRPLALMEAQGEGEGDPNMGSDAVGEGEAVPDGEAAPRAGDVDARGEAVAGLEAEPHPDAVGDADAHADADMLPVGDALALDERERRGLCEGETVGDGSEETKGDMVGSGEAVGTKGVDVGKEGVGAPVKEGVTDAEPPCCDDEPRGDNEELGLPEGDEEGRGVPEDDIDTLGNELALREAPSFRE